MVTITRNPAIIGYSVTFFYLLKHALLSRVAFRRKIVARVSLPISAHASSTHLSGSADHVPPSAIATVVGILAAFAVAGFRHAMLLLEWLFLNNDSGSLVNAATSLSPCDGCELRRRRTGGGLLPMGWQKFTHNALMRRLITWKRCKPMDSSITQQAWLNRLPRCW